MASTSENSPEGSTDTTLLRRAQLHDADAWSHLVDLYGPLIFYWCRRKGQLSSADASDVFQEVFASVSTGLERFDLHRRGRTFRGWLWTITSNKLRDRFRRQAGEPAAAGGTAAWERLQQLPDDWDDQSADPRDRSEMQSLYQRALEIVREHFEPRTWEAFWRTTVEGQATAHVAEDLGLTENSVRKYKSRVIRRLRQELGDFPA